MKPHTLSLLLSLALFATSAARAQEADAFHARVATLYAFHPHALTPAQVNAKSGELDAFWKAVKADPPRQLPLLRTELARASTHDFFAYDGAKLLLSLSSAPADHRLALAAVAKADLLDVQPEDYLKTVHRFASEGLDTRDAAFHLLSEPAFKAYIPEHALWLGQDYALVWLLYPMPQATFEQDVLARLATEPDPTAQKSLLVAAWYLATPASAQAIAAVIARPGVDAGVVARARELQARDTGVGLSVSSAATLREERATMMRRPISDEALIEFDRLTNKLMARR